MKKCVIGLRGSGFRCCELLLLLLLTGGYRELAAQTPSQTPPNETVKTHFVAAQRAQQQKDYATAEQEYQVVLAAAPDFAEAHMNLGLVYQLENRVPDAMSEFRRALKINPSLMGANFFLGVDYCNMGQGASALPYLQRVVHEDAKRPEAWWWLATAQEMAGNTKAEVATLTRALTMHPQNIDLLYLLGRAYERMGKTEVLSLEKIAADSSWSEQLVGESYATGNNWTFAVIHFQNALATAPVRPGLHAELGEVLLHGSRIEAAASEFDRELQVDPHNLRALVRRGEVKLIQGDAEGCLRDWAQAISIDEPRAEQVLSIREIGFGDAASEQLPDALREKVEKLASWLHDQPGPAAHFALAFLATQAGNPSQAEAEIASMKLGSSQTPSSRCGESLLRENLAAERFSKVSPCFPALASKLPVALRIPAARALFEVGEYGESVKLLSGLTAQEARSPAAFYWRARSYEKLATVAYLHLYQADPESYRVHQLLGDLAAANADDGKAIAEYRAAIAQKPSISNLHYNLGHLLWKNLDTAQARAEFEAELALNPHHAGALHDLGNTYLLDHEPEKALPYLTRALAIDPADPELHRDLGTGYSELQDYRKAEAEFKMAVPADNDGSVHYKLARVYQALGEKDKAATEFALSTQMNRESHRKVEQQTERLKSIQELPGNSSDLR